MAMDTLKLRAIAENLRSKGFDAEYVDPEVVVRIPVGNPAKLLSFEEESLSPFRHRFPELEVRTGKDPDELGPWTYTLS